MKRPDWDIYFLNIAKDIASRSTCLRTKYGAVIVKDRKIISTGYNGAPSGIISCDQRGKCIKDVYSIPHGKKTYDLCYSVHAEINALIQAGERSVHADLYLYGIDSMGIDIFAVPCYMCIRVIRNARIREIVSLDNKAVVRSSVEGLAIKECAYDIIQRIELYKGENK